MLASVSGQLEWRQNHLPIERVPVPNFDAQQFAEQYFPRIHRAALMLTGNPWDADDLVQETFLAVSRQADQFAGRSSPFTWLYGILLNVDRRWRRRNAIGQHKLRVLWNNQADEPPTSPRAETPIEVSEWKRGLWAHVSKLPEGQRQVLVLRFSEQLRYEEIAEVMGCPLGTVKSRIYHGLAALRAALQPGQDEACEVPRFTAEDISHAG